MDSAAAARLRHLQASAHALASTAPAISAHLMSRFYKLASDKGIPVPDAQRREACSACGAILKSGQTASIYTGRQEDSACGKRKRTCAAEEGEVPPEDVRQRGGPVITASCWLCGEKLSPPPPPPPPKAERPSLHAVKGQARAQAQALADSSEKAPKHGSAEPGKALSSNSKSKQRAKARKHQSLHDMLAKKETSAPNIGSSTGLSLMDFLL